MDGDVAEVVIIGRIAVAITARIKEEAQSEQAAYSK